MKIVRIISLFICAYTHGQIDSNAKYEYSYADTILMKEYTQMIKFKEDSTYIPSILSNPCFDENHPYQNLFFAHGEITKISVRMKLISMICDQELLLLMYKHTIKNPKGLCKTKDIIPYKDWTTSQLLQKRISELNGEIYMR